MPQIYTYPATGSLWHGTKPEILHSIFKAGYANLASTDCGYFGKGLYSAYEAEYAYKYYYKGALILNWVSSYSAYPVIAGDMKKITAKGTYKNYDTNFIPVVPYNRNNKDNFVPSNPDEVNDVYLPCDIGQQPLYTEVVVFEKAQCLPRYLVTLQATLLFMPSLATNSQADLNRSKKMEIRRKVLQPSISFVFPVDYLQQESKRKEKMLMRQTAIYTGLSNAGLATEMELVPQEESSSSNKVLGKAEVIPDMLNLPGSAMNSPTSSDERLLNISIIDLDEVHSPKPLLFSAPQLNANVEGSSSIAGCDTKRVVFMPQYL